MQFAKVLVALAAGAAAFTAPAASKVSKVVVRGENPNDDGKLGAGGMADALKYMEIYKLKWIAVGHGDGSGRLVTKEELASLPWGTPQEK